MMHTVILLVHIATFLISSALFSSDSTPHKAHVQEVQKNAAKITSVKQNQLRKGASNIIRWTQHEAFQDAFSSWPFSTAETLDGAIDLCEDKHNNMLVKMAIPGVDPAQIEISIDGDLLHIKGTREEEEESNEKDYYYKEIRRGSFERTIRLPTAVIAEQVQAASKDGILSITMPKKHVVAPERIKVSVAH